MGYRRPASPVDHPAKKRGEEVQDIVRTYSGVQGDSPPDNRGEHADAVNDPPGNDDEPANTYPVGDAPNSLPGNGGDLTQENNEEGQAASSPRGSDNERPLRARLEETLRHDRQVLAIQARIEEALRHEHQEAEKAQSALLRLAQAKIRSAELLKDLAFAISE